MLVSWANHQDAWIRELVSDVIVTGKPISDARAEDLYDLFLREKNLRTGDAVAAQQLRDDVFDLAAAEPLVLNRMEDLQDVNALAPGQHISFNPKLTIVFGENATGKTGYVRVLKRAAAARTAEPILPDMNAPQPSASTSPSARITYTAAGQQKVLIWLDEAGVAPLNRIDVFDSRSLSLHVDADLTYIYTPGELARFPLVQQGIEQVRSKLERDIKDASTRVNPFVTHFERTSRLYSLVESLGAASDLNKLRQIASVTEEEGAHVATLRTEIDALKSTTPQAQLRLAETQRQHVSAILQALSTVGAFDAAGYERGIQQMNTARQDYERATQSSFAGMSIPGVLQEEWKRFIQAGEEYLQHHDDPTAYPREDDKCLYCRQPLTPEAISLLRKYRDYCNGEFRSALNRAQETINQITAALRTVDTTRLRQRLAELNGEGGPLAPQRVEDLNSALTKLDELRGACEAGRPYAWPERAEQATRLQSVVQTADQKLAALAADLKDRSEKRQQTLREREAHLLDIESRMRLVQMLPEIEKFVERAKWVDQAGIQTRRFQGILRSLTEASKAASEQLLNRDFERRFSEECTKLRAPKVRLLFPGKQGQVSRRKALAADHRLSEVLSEGEQKVIALADFLAEAALKPAAPVIFDDPITSLDYRRMSEVVKRIVDLSEQRQVTIFTHNIWFTTELLAAFEKRPQDCAYYDVTRDGNKIGVVSKGTHPRSDTYKPLRAKITVLIQAADKETGEVQAALIEKAYEYLRNVCEVIVESELLQGVTQRYQPNVRMTMLPNIKYCPPQASSGCHLPDL